MAPPAFREGLGGLHALTHFALMAAGADLIVAFEATADGLATPLAAAPATISDAFHLRSSRIFELDWSDGAPRDADTLRLPSILLHALGRPAQRCLFVATPVEDAPRSGLILLWGANGARACDCAFSSDVRAGVPMLAGAFSHMLGERRAGVRRQLIQDRFHDLLESVPTGIVLIEGDSRSGLVNERAGALLGVPPGSHPVSELVAPMRELRAACVNREELEAMFLALIADVDYAAATIWDLGSRQFEVDTHPIRGDGRNGRIWLFHDVTAERRSEAALRTLATSDALTGIANRRHFEERARAAIEAARLSGDPLSLLMIDIDHFKAINDGFGHPAGDEVLRVIAGRCADALGPRDLIARLGGEEFGVLLPATSPDKALLIARRLCTTIADTPVLAGATSIEVRASIGGAATTDSDTLDALLARADAALYYSKRNGRARVTFEGVTPVA